MKLFTPEQVKTEASKQEDLLELRINYLKGEEKKWAARVAEHQREYEELKDTDVKQISGKKAKLLKELHQIEVELAKKKDLIDSIMARQDELDEREAELKRKEENLRLREDYVKQVEHKIVEMSHV